MFVIHMWTCKNHMKMFFYIWKCPLYVFTFSFHVKILVHLGNLLFTFENIQFTFEIVIFFFFSTCETENFTSYTAWNRFAVKSILTWHILSIFIHGKWLEITCVFTAGLWRGLSQLWWRWTRWVQRDPHACINWTQPIWLPLTKRASLKTSVSLGSSGITRRAAAVVFVKYSKAIAR